MTTANPLNVYTGPDSLRKYYDPDCQPLLPLVEVPGKLNPFRRDRVRIYAKMMNALPAHNVKVLPALRMLQSDTISKETKTLVESSSGSTVVSMAIIARIFHQRENMCALVSNKTTEGKVKMMQFFGLNITLFGGPSQPEPADPRGGIQIAQRMADAHEAVEHLNQFANPLNPDAHSRWTGPQLMRQLPQMNVFCAGMGTAGTMTGTGAFLKQAKPSIIRVGVCTAPGDSVPGPRPHSLVARTTLPWSEAVDSVEEVCSLDSYRLSLALSREGLICGPSSGFNLQGLYQFLQKRKDQGTLDDLAEPDGDIHCVFICCDLPYQYMDDYFKKLGPDHFRPLNNENLLRVDRYRYEARWELEAKDAIELLYHPRTMSDATSLIATDTSDPGPPQHNSTLRFPLEPSDLLTRNPVLIDLRCATDYQARHLIGAVNIPLRSLAASTTSPFTDAEILEAQWLELKALFDPQHSPSSALASDSTGLTSSSLLSSLKGNRVVLVCYTGDASYVATSVFRAKGIEAYSIKNGLDALLSRA